MPHTKSCTAVDKSARHQRHTCCLQEWLHTGLSVLMNVTHNNEAGRKAVAEAGGLEALAQLVACCAAPALGIGGSASLYL